MSRIEPLAVGELPAKARADMDFAAGLMGFVPNDVLTMAKWPALLDAARQLISVVYAPGEVDPILKRLVATIVSGVSGCRYCQAHTAHGAVKMAGADKAKVAEVWSWQTSVLFTDAERAALDLAFAAGQNPNAATDEHFDRLRQHFSEQAILELVGIIALFGFLNRWNDTLATELEAAPLNFGRTVLQQKDWEPGKHLR